MKKILNLYAGLGGNRKLWGGENMITAVEYDPQIAAIYKDFYPNDKVIVGDAHEYLLNHYKEFDFIWSSPPCPTHSRARFWSSKGGMYEPVYPDMTLYQEIVFLQNFFDGKFCVENVIPYYTPLIKAQEVGRHLFWANFTIPKMAYESNYIHSGEDKKRVEESLGFNLDKYSIPNKTKLLRNCVNPSVGKIILDHVLEIETQNNIVQGTLFN